MTASPGPLRIAIGEDHADLAQALAMLIDLQPDMRHVGQSPTTVGLLELADRESPDAYVLDLALADGSCIPLIRTLRARYPHCLIIAFSGLEDSALRSACRNAGCNLTLRKDGRPMVVIEALRQLRGG